MTPPESNDAVKGSKEWESLRAAFASSIMAETPLRSLAQSLDGPDWPISGADETPAQYIDLPYADAKTLLASKGQPAERINRLMDILRGTLAFDHPFGDMIEQTAAAEARDNPLLKNFARLGIPESFPVELTTLGPDTLEFCRMEKLGTLSEFAVFAQGVAQTVIVGGDFRRLLNALAHVDEESLAELLPYRRGCSGLHLVEALAQASRRPNPAVRAARAIEWFGDEWRLIRKDAGSGSGLARHLSVLGDPVLEKKVAALVKSALGSPESPPDDRRPEHGRLWTAVAGMLRRQRL